MQILIFEGIATSGKTTVINKLAKSLPDLVKVRIFTEQFTHEPIIKKKEGLHKDFFTKLITEAMSGNYDVVLFDRLYLTQAFRAKKSLKEFLDIETMLFVNYVTTIFLLVDESGISKSISGAIKHRDTSWGEYVKTKGQTALGQADYYIDQQRRQLKLLKESMLPYKIYNTTNGNYEKIVEDLKFTILSEV